MRELIGRLLSIGAADGDDEDTTLRKVLLLVAARNGKQLDADEASDDE